jgi:hypothetical protein
MQHRPFFNLRALGGCLRLAGFCLVAGLLLAAVPLQAFLTNQQLRIELESAISRRVAHDSSGRTYLLTIERAHGWPATVRLQVGEPTARSMADFTELALPVRAAGFEDSVLSAGFVVDGQDRLHVVWTSADGRTGYTMKRPAKPGETRSADWVNPVTGARGALILAPDSSRIGDIVSGPKGEPWLVWSVSQPSHQTVHHVGTWIDDRWQVRPVAEGYGFFPPSLLVDRQGSFHLAWHDIYETSWALAGDFAALDSTSRPEPRRLTSSGLRPVMAPLGESLLIVRENNHHQLQYFQPAKVPTAPALFTGAGDDRRFDWDTVHSPQLVVDGHGIPWVFFIDSARRTVFHSRWLGTRWGPIETTGSLVRNTSRMEDSHLAINRIAVDVRVTKGGSDIAVLMENTSDAPAVSFRRIPVPAPVAEPGRKLLFLDLGDLATLDGVMLNLNSPQKKGRIVNSGQPGDFDSHRTGPFLRVLKENNRYRMWYSGYKMPPPGAGWWEGYRVGYAESADGRQFQPVNLGLTPFNGQPDSNVIPGLPYVPQGMLYDAQEPRPERRYKLLKFPSAGAHNDEARAGRMDPWSSRINGQLLVSADGIHWSAEPASMDFPGGRPQELIPQSFFHDTAEPDAAKRYKVYGYSSLNAHRRTGSVAYSADGRQWTAWHDNPALDPFVSAEIPVRGGIVNQIHDTVVWQYGDHYLALYQYQHDKELLDIRLAVSRDGEHFTFVRPGQVFLSPGKPGEWDAMHLNPSVPLVDDNEIKVYYGAVHEDVAQHRGGLGLATLRIDGFTDLRIQPGRKAASFTTVPLQPGQAAKLLLNADAGGGRITVELIDAVTGQTLPGYDAASCIPITGDALAHPVRWQGQSDLRAVRGEFKVRVSLEGAAQGPKVYSLQFQ